MHRIFVIFVLFSINGFAQQNYVVTLANDTLKGNVVRGNMYSNNLTLKTQKGKQKLHLREIKEWYNGKSLIIVHKDTSGKKETFYEYALEIEGKIKLLWNIHYDWVYVYSLYINKEYISATPANMSNYIWPKLLQKSHFTINTVNILKNRLESYLTTINLRLLRK